MHIFHFPLADFPTRAVVGLLSELNNKRGGTGEDQLVFSDQPSMYVFLAHSADVVPFETQLKARVSYYYVIEESDLPLHILYDPGYLYFTEKNP